MKNQKSQALIKNHKKIKKKPKKQLFLGNFGWLYLVGFFAATLG